MTRLLLTIVLPLLLPTALYLLWRAAAQRVFATPARLHAESRVIRPRFGRRGLAALPWSWLIVAGVALAAITLTVINVHFGAGPRGTYIPPHVVDGRVEPGHVVPSQGTP